MTRKCSIAVDTVIVYVCDSNKHWTGTDWGEEYRLHCVEVPIVIQQCLCKGCIGSVARIEFIHLRLTHSFFATQQQKQYYEQVCDQNSHNIQWYTSLVYTLQLTSQYVHNAKLMPYFIDKSRANPHYNYIYGCWICCLTLIGQN